MNTKHLPHTPESRPAINPSRHQRRHRRARAAHLTGIALGLLLGAGFENGQAALWSELSQLPVEMKVLDFDGDGASDVVMVRGAEVWIRFDAARPESDWTSVAISGWSGQFTGGVRVAAGDINNDGFHDLGLAEAGANRMLVAFGQSDRATPPRMQEINIPGGPTGMDLFHSLADGSATLSLLALETPEPYVIQASATAAETPIAASRFGISIDGVEFDAHLDFLTVSLDGDAPVESFWLHHPPTTGGIEPAPILTWYGPPDTALGRIHKVSDVTLKRGIVGATATWIPGLTPTPAMVLWGGGMSDLTVAKPNGNGGVELLEEEIGFVYHTVKFQQLEIPDLGPGSGRLLITHADARRLSIYRWSTSGQLELIGSIVPPADRTFLDASMLGDGGLAALFGDATAGARSTVPVGLGFFEDTATGWVLRFETDLPQFAQRPTLSRVRILDRDPFTDGQARELESLTAGDWARDALISDSTVTVLSATFLDSLRGLGAGTLQTLTLTFTPPRGAFALANQWEPDSSLFFGARPAVPGSAAVLAQPPPGSHPGPVQLQFAAGADVIVFSRVGEAAWLEGRGPYTIDHTALVEYYGVDAAGRASPRQSGQYIITQATHTPEGPLLADTDGDGLDDAWERLLFGGLESDPRVDHDGDGFTTGEEYLAGTDPRDPNSRPDGEPQAPLLLDMALATNGRLALTWLGAAGDQFGVDISTDLLQWSRSAAPTEYRDGAHHWEDPDPTTDSRFYRVARLP
jgi:hypothetical protein